MKTKTQNLWPKRIKNIRKALSEKQDEPFTQQDLAELLLLTVSTISRWENGKHIPDRRARRDLRQLEQKLKDEGLL